MQNNVSMTNEVTIGISSWTQKATPISPHAATLQMTRLITDIIMSLTAGMAANDLEIHGWSVPTSQLARSGQPISSHRRIFAPPICAAMLRGFARRFSSLEATRQWRLQRGIMCITARFH